MQRLSLSDNCPYLIFNFNGQLSACQEYSCKFLEKWVVSSVLTYKKGIDADEHRRVILKNAKALFSEQGVDNVSMHQIAKSAGIGQGTLYRRYAHKGELCLDIMRESSLHVSEEIERYLAAGGDIPVRERLEKVLQILLDYLEEKSQWLEAIQAPTCEGRRSIIYHSPMYQSLHATISGLLSEALKGTGSPQNPTFMSDAIIASISPDIYIFLRQDRGYSLDDIRLNLHKVFLDPLFSK
jgi:AcrR family transcriptional regulator